ncbi:hypothetical protein JCM30566_10560 [Marinitoga arctica]
MILNQIKMLPKRYVYFFSEVKNEMFYMNDIGSLYIMQGKKNKSPKKTFLNFNINNLLIYKILKLIKKALIPFTIWDLLNFYKKNYTIRYLKQNNEILALYILKNNIVEFVFLENENLNLISQLLNDISFFVNEDYMINVFSDQKNVFNFLLNNKFIKMKKFNIYKLNGYGIYITEPQKNDSSDLVNFYEEIFENSNTLATQLKEFNRTVKDFESIINLSKNLFGLRILVAKYENKIIGNCDIHWNIHRERLKKTAKLGVSVLEDFRNKGIATTLIKNHISWCIETPVIHRLELEVFSNNPHAISLYEKLGFIKEGTRKEAAYIDSNYYDIIFMGYITEPEKIFFNM